MIKNNPNSEDAVDIALVDLPSAPNVSTPRGDHFGA